MQKRNTQQRRDAIIERLHSQGKVAVDDLARVFSTSEVTIRKDLAELESRGFLVRRFGGAVPIQNKAEAPEVNQLSNRKQAIGQLAATLIQDSSRIVIDSGSTTSALLPHLVNKSGLVLMTNSLNVANTVLTREKEAQVLMTGGTWDAQSQSFQGQMAEQMLQAYNFDQAFLGAAGLDPKRGSTTFNELTSVSRAMAAVSSEVIVLAESDKFERKIPNVELPWADISVLVTDDGIDNAVKAEIEQHGVKVLCATSEVNTSGE